MLGFRWLMTETESTSMTMTGFYAAVSVGGVATGLGGEFLLGDDLLSAEDGFSEAARRAINRWITSTWATRVNDPATGIFVFVSQRLAEDDPTGYLLETQPNRCLHIKIPLEAEEDETYVFPISGRVFKRKTADVLQPERFTPSVVENLKKNSREWACNTNSGLHRKRVELSRSTGGGSTFVRAVVCRMPVLCSRIASTRSSKVGT